MSPKDSIRAGVTSIVSDEPYPLDMQWDLVYMDIKNPKAHDLMDTFYPNKPEHSAAKLARSPQKNSTI
jgi:hypothetical protein